jgi:hypothetical protein
MCVRLLSQGEGPLRYAPLASRDSLPSHSLPRSCPTPDQVPARGFDGLSLCPSMRPDRMLLVVFCFPSISELYLSFPDLPQEGHARWSHFARKFLLRLHAQVRSRRSARRPSTGLKHPVQPAHKRRPGAGGMSRKSFSLRSRRSSAWEHFCASVLAWLHSVDCLTSKIKMTKPMPGLVSIFPLLMARSIAWLHHGSNAWEAVGETLISIFGGGSAEMLSQPQSGTPK